MAKRNDEQNKHPYTSIFGSATVDQFKETVLRYLLSFQGRDPQRAGNRDMYKALSYALRDVLVEKWIETQKAFYARKSKRVYYLSLEFMVGRTLGNSLLNMGLLDEATQALEQLGYDMEIIREQEEDAGLGNGGLGRLASCFMDSMATMALPAYGYGIRYEYGLFFQKMIDGYQVEQPDSWLRYGTPWEFKRSSFVYPVHFYGRVHSYIDNEGCYRSRWLDTEDVMVMACDMLVPGFNNNHVINMRLWTARASRELDLAYFNAGDYIGAVRSKVESETISKVLYPSDDIRQGQELRLKQQYFFVAATFQDIFRRFHKTSADIESLPDQVAVQLNDTHPAIAIPELMRLLLDQTSLGWERAWDISTKTFAFTNHTLMPEALETWPVDMVSRLLPRHMEIIYEINRRFLVQVAHFYPGDSTKQQAMSIIDDRDGGRVRMAHLAIIGSHSVNGVARLHAQLLKTRIFRDFHDFFPDRFNSKTNGITPRRWLLKANPALSRVISDEIGYDWVTDLDQLRQLERLADDPAFQLRWQQARLENKRKLASLIKGECGVEVNCNSLFDVQIKRVHEYKRQLLNIMHVIALYQRILARPGDGKIERTVIFAGKAAPSYRRAKLIIKLINGVGEVVNNDPRIGSALKVVFIPNYNVSLAEKIIPAADLSQQISTAGTEASGTGNMKLSLNGALTVGTLDGATIEIKEEVGEENMYIFGLSADEVEYERLSRSRSSMDIYRQTPEIRQVLDSIDQGTFSKGDDSLFNPLVASLLIDDDPYLLLADFASYLAVQKVIEEDFIDESSWTRKSILTVARMGKFSSDRAVAEYAKEIWGIPVNDLQG